MSEAETVEHTKLLSEYRALDAEWSEADDIPEDIDARLVELAEAMEALEARPMIFDPAEIIRAGVFVSFDRDGKLVVHRSFVRPEDEAPIQGPDADNTAGQVSDPHITGSEPTQ